MKRPVMTMWICVVGMILGAGVTGWGAPMGTAFKYQGSLKDGDSPADGSYDFVFYLYDASVGGSLKDIETKNGVVLLDGYFDVELDFGSNDFSGEARWLEICVDDGSTGLTKLLPRQEVTPTPYAVYAANAGSDNDWMVSGNNMYAIPSGTVTVSRSVDAAGPVLKVSRSAAPPIVFQKWMEIDTTSIDTYSRSFVMTGSVLTLNGNSSGNVILAEGGGDVILAGGGGDVILTGGGGNVGIGTSNPQSKLSVGGDGLLDTGVYGIGDFIGVYGKTSAPSGSGVIGINDGGGNGVYGSGYHGVYGVGDFVGVSGRDSDTSSFGFLGYHTMGGYFVGDDNSAGGDSYGVYSWARRPGGTNYGIYAKASGGTTNYAGYFDGDVRVNGNLMIYSGSTLVLELGTGLDYAEGFDVSESTKIDAGSVLIIDADNPGKLALSNKPYDSKVAGIVAGAKGIGSGVRLGTGEFDHDVALAGRVYCNVDTTQAGVEPGDLLTTSATPGYAMKSTDYARAQGAILGKAMESLEKGQKGQILVLVTLQ